MDALFRLAAEPRNYAPAILAVSIGALAAAYTAQYGFDLEPCILCLYQRVPYGLAAVIAIAAMVVSADQVRLWLVGLAGLVFLAGAGIAAYHVGVEQHWWEAVTSCSGGLNADITIADLQKALSTKPPKRCDDVTWTLFGLSMATYNAAMSLGLAVACAAAAKHMNRRNAA